MKKEQEYSHILVEIFLNNIVIVEEWGSVPPEFWRSIHKKGVKFAEHSSSAYEFITIALAVMTLILNHSIPDGSEVKIYTDNGPSVENINKYRNKRCWKLNEILHIMAWVHDLKLTAVWRSRDSDEIKFCDSLSKYSSRACKDLFVNEFSVVHKKECFNRVRVPFGKIMDLLNYNSKLELQIRKQKFGSRFPVKKMITNLKVKFLSELCV